MKKAQLLILAYLITSLVHLYGAEIVGSWPLCDSLENKAGRLNLDPYTAGQKISPTKVSFKESAMEAGGVALFAAPALSVSAGITVTGWLKPSALELGFSPTAPHTLVRLYDSFGANDAQFVFRILDTKFGAYVGSSKKNISTSFMAVETEWSFFVFVLTEEAVRIYLDGYPAQVSPIAKNTDRYNRFYVGAVDSKVTRSFPGLMKQIKLFSGALTEQEIKEIYEKEK